MKTNTKNLLPSREGTANILLRKPMTQATNRGSFLIMLEPAAVRQKRKSASEKTGNCTHSLICMKSNIHVSDGKKMIGK